MITALRNYASDAWSAWNEFWFTPTNPATLSAIRVLAGAMLFYTHLIWSLDLEAFFGQRGWLPAKLLKDVSDFVGGPDAPTRWNWSYFNVIDSPRFCGSFTCWRWSFSLC